MFFHIKLMVKHSKKLASRENFQGEIKYFKNFLFIFIYKEKFGASKWSRS